jgi:hypothetical protein
MFVVQEVEQKAVAAPKMISGWYKRNGPLFVA